MQTKPFRIIVLYLLLASQANPLPAYSLVNSDQTAKDTNLKSVALTAKWSLPFQGQLGTNPPADKAAAAQDKANELSLFKAKKVQTLTFSAPETLSNAEIIGDQLDNDSATKKGKFISGEISVWDGPFDGDRIVNHLLETHFANSAEGKKLDQQVKKHSTLTRKAIAVTKDGLEEVFGYQGFDPSMRAGQLILDSPKMPIRNKAWADYVRQRYIDKIHAQVVNALMQLAEGIGNNESEQGAKTIAKAKEELSALVGNEEAERAVKALNIWLNNIHVPYATFAQTPWNTAERTKKLEEILTVSIEHDPVITKVTERVKKYATPGTFKRRSSQVIQTGLNGATIFAPGIIPSVAAGSALIVFKTSTGGTEENKLERELLFDKRIQSRLKVLSEEAALAVDNYRYAIVTKNPPLLAFSQEVIENLTGQTADRKLISSRDVPAKDYDSENKAVPEIKEDGSAGPSQPESRGKALIHNLRQATLCSDK